MSVRAFRGLLGSAIILTAILAVGCEKPQSKPPQQTPPVTTCRPVEREVVQWDQYSANLSSPDTVDVKARVSGLIVSAPFKEGALVKKDQILFKIDPAPFKADLDSKNAAVAQAKSMEDQAKVHLDRYAKVVGTQAISKDDYDAANAAYEEAVASYNAARASAETAQLNLEWTDVKAPISGRISKMDVTVGNLVNGGSGQATLLTTIVSVDPMYCYVFIPQNAALRYQKLALAEKQANVAGAKIPCYLQLQDETTFSHSGVIDFVDNQVDVNTGTVQIRGVFPNPNGLLTPGLFVMMRIPASGRYKAILIPDSAVNTNQNERYLLIVGPDNTVQLRPVKLGALFGTLRAIESGLQGDEQVIVSGVQFARPGGKVNPHEQPISEQSLAELEKIISGSPATQAAAMTLPETQPDSQPSQPEAGQ